MRTQFNSDFSPHRENVVDVSLKRLPPKIKETEVKYTSGENDELMKILFPSVPPKTELTNTKQGVRVFVNKPPKSEPQHATNKPDTEERSSPEMKNPLYWFGYFPPPALTQAQNLYLQGTHTKLCAQLLGLETAMLMAKEKRRIEKLEKQLQTLFIQKKQLQ